MSDVRRQAPLAPQVQQGSRAAATAAPKEKGWAEIPRADREAFDRHLLKPFMAKGLKREEAQAKYADGYWKEGVIPPTNERRTRGSARRRAIRGSRGGGADGSRRLPAVAVRRAKTAEQTERRRRQPGSLNRMVTTALSIPEECKDPDYHYHWVNDVRGRVQGLTTHDDYDVVTMDELDEPAPQPGRTPTSPATTSAAPVDRFAGGGAGWHEGGAAEEAPSLLRRRLPGKPRTAPGDDAGPCVRGRPGSRRHGRGA